MMNNEFSSIRFGFTSAEAESAEDPGLLLEGYVEIHSSFKEALDGSKFLFLGYKGSGKSAIGERLKLFAEDKDEYFVRKMDLEDFPFTPFSKIIKGNAEPEAKYPTAWSWILLIYIMNSLARDEALQHPDPGIFWGSIKAFEAMGLSPAANPGQLVRAASKASFKLMIPNIAEASAETQQIRPASEIPDFVESLKETLRLCRSQNKHYLVIDGLDDILTKRDVQFDSIGALLFETNRLNQDLKRNFVPAKIILVCRTDLFERLSGANKNKLRQDYANELDWYHDTKQPDNSFLIKIANVRAERSLQRNIDIFKDFFPLLVDGHDTRTALLEMTRHTPRDFIQLLTNIQSFCKGDKVTHDDVKNGMRIYSIKYFLPEIRDELSGYATREEFEKIIELIGGLKKRDFTLRELVAQAATKTATLSEERIREILLHMFSCSAIGNIQKRPGGNTFYTFNYRNRHSVFNEAEGIMLHRGLWKALNLV